MKRLLILFANGFPYNGSEYFLEAEYPLYRQYYDKVLIVTSCKRKEYPTRNITDESIEVVSDYTLSKDVFSIIEALPWMITDSMFYAELKQKFREGLSLRTLYDLVVFSLCGNHRAMLARRWLKRHPEYECCSIYSYWLHIPAYAAVRLNMKLKDRIYTISRAHGFDVYLERSRGGYIPFHKQIYKKLDEIAFVSNNGKTYLTEKYGMKEKTTVHRLGALDIGFCNPVVSRKIFNIVTCARTIPLKRLERLAEVLSKITDRIICWTHIGDGESQEDLKQYVLKNMPDNVKVSLLGAIPNSQVYEMYRNTPIHVFINVSETEGIPVSIMEAMSFSIPVIATAVGGTPELVEYGVNGYLLPKDFLNSELETHIRRIMEMPEELYMDFRSAARKKFKQDYDAISNYHKFIQNMIDR